MESAVNAHYRRFDDIPIGVTFADKFGRMFTKTSVGSARGDEVFDQNAEEFSWTFDTSRIYYDATEDELEDCDMWDAWPYYYLRAE